MFPSVLENNRNFWNLSVACVGGRMIEAHMDCGVPGMMGTCEEVYGPVCQLNNCNFFIYIAIRNGLLFMGRRPDILISEVAKIRQYPRKLCCFVLVLFLPETLRDK